MRKTVRGRTHYRRKNVTMRKRRGGMNGNPNSRTAPSIPVANAPAPLAAAAANNNSRPTPRPVVNVESEARRPYRPIISRPAPLTREGEYPTANLASYFKPLNNAFIRTELRKKIRRLPAASKP